MDLQADAADEGLVRCVQLGHGPSVSSDPRSRQYIATLKNTVCCAHTSPVAMAVLMMSLLQAPESTDDDS
jgi:hypothetical protein